MPIREELKLSDGKRLADLESVLSKRRSPKSLINELLGLITDNEPTIQIGATWLLKRLAESKTHFSNGQVAAMFDSLAEITCWEAKLQICQMLQHLKISKGSESKVAWFLERNLSEQNKFLRAWSYNGFYELAIQYPEYHELAMKQLDRGESEKSAAVRARLRNIRKAMQKL